MFGYNIIKGVLLMIALHVYAKQYTINRSEPDEQKTGGLNFEE